LFFVCFGREKRGKKIRINELTLDLLQIIALWNKNITNPQKMVDGQLKFLYVQFNGNRRHSGILGILRLFYKNKLTYFLFFRTRQGDKAKKNNILLIISESLLKLSVS
jgi:hypothetical protein